MFKIKELKSLFVIEKNVLGMQTVKTDEQGNVETGLTTIEIKPSTIIERLKNVLCKSEYKQFIPENKLNEVLDIPCRNERLIRELK